MESRQTFSRNWVELPTAVTAVTPTAGGMTFNRGGGWIYTLVASTVVQLDLSTVDWNGPPNRDDPTEAGYGLSDVYFSIIVSGTVPVYIAGYPTAAAATASPPVASGWTSGLNPAGFSVPIFPTPATGPAQDVDAGRFLARRGVNSVIAMVAAGTPTVFIYRSGAYQESR